MPWLLLGRAGVRAPARIGRPHREAPGGPVGGTSVAPWGVHDDRHAREADQRARDVPAVRAVAVRRHAPQDRAGHEDAAVRGEDAAEVGVGLEGGDEAVGAEGEDAARGPHPAAVLPYALPDQPGAADLEEGGDDEEGGGAGYEHGDQPRMPVHRPGCHLMEGACRPPYVGYIPATAAVRAAGARSGWHAGA